LKKTSNIPQNTPCKKSLGQPKNH